MLFDAISFEESAATLTLTWSKTRGRCKCRGPWLCWTGLRSSWSNSFNPTVRTVSQGRLPPPKGGERGLDVAVPCKE